MKPVRLKRTTYTNNGEVRIDAAVICQ